MLHRRVVGLGEEKSEAARFEHRFLLRQGVIQADAQLLEHIRAARFAGDGAAAVFGDETA
jgi:hypothetical protein